MFNLENVYIFEEVKGRLQKNVKFFMGLEDEELYYDSLVDFSRSWNLDFSCFLVKNKQEYSELIQIFSKIKTLTRGESFICTRVYPEPFPLFFFIRDFEEDDVIVREKSVPKILNETALLLKAIQDSDVCMKEYLTHEDPSTRSAAKFHIDLRKS